jgi:hypothetical protein
MKLIKVPEMGLQGMISKWLKSIGNYRYNNYNNNLTLTIHPKYTYQSHLNKKANIKGIWNN